MLLWRISSSTAFHDSMDVGVRVSNVQQYAYREPFFFVYIKKVPGPCGDRAGWGGGRLRISLRL